jgi:adhesin transport system outer membrane protein
MTSKFTLRKIPLIILSLFAALPVYAESVKSVIEKTLYNNPDVLLSKNTRDASNAGVDIARGPYFPRVDITAGISREYNRNIATQFRRRTLDRKEASVTLDQLVFDGLGRFYELERNKFKTNADAYRVWAVAEEISLAALTAYVDVLRDQEINSISQRYLNRLREIENLVNMRSETGLGREADTNQARSRVALGRANVSAAANNLHDSESRYLRVVGELPRSLQMPASVKGSSIPNTLQGVIDVAVNHHPFIRSARADVAEAQAQHNVTHSLDFPQINFLATATRRQNSSGVIGPDDDAAAVLQLTYNIFRGGSDQALQTQTFYEINQALDIRDRTIREVIENSRFAWAALQAANQRVVSLNDWRNNAQKTVTSYTEQFKIGKRTLLDLLDTENEHFEAQVAYTNERFLQLLQTYRIIQSMGKLLEYFGIELPQQAMVPYDEHYAFPLGMKTEHLLIETHDHDPDEYQRLDAASYKQPPKRKVQYEQDVADKKTAKQAKLSQTKKKWWVQVATFSKAENADRLLKQLQQAKQSSKIVLIEQPNGEPMHVIFAGPMGSQQVAEQFKQTADQKFKVSSLVKKLS